jgi:hypothetical protein
MRYVIKDDTADFDTKFALVLNKVAKMVTKARTKYYLIFISMACLIFTIPILV